MPSVLDEIHDTQGTAADLAARDRGAVARPTPRIPVVAAGGRGATLIDADGRELTDLTSGWNVTNTGWNHPEVIAAVRTQAEQLAFSPPWCSHQGRVTVAERLSEAVGFQAKTLCVVSGSEAVEAALKVARRATGRHATVAFTEAYHGGTLGAMLAGGVPQLRGVDLPPDEWHRHAPIPDMLRRGSRDYAEEARRVILADPAPAAVLLEPVFTNPGVIHGDGDFYKAIAEAAAEAGALVIMDEVGTGFGRTGQMFGFQNWPIQPDIVTVAKGLSSGVVPMAGAVMRAELADAVAGPGFSSTFGWTPLACAAAHATLDVIQREDLAGRARRLGEEALGRLRPLVEQVPHVADVRGMGLEMGIELTAPDGSPLPRPPMEHLTRRLLERGVFAEPSAYTSTLLLMPPLVIPDDQLWSALDIVAEEIAALNIEELSS